MRCADRLFCEVGFPLRRQAPWRSAGSAPAAMPHGGAAARPNRRWVASTGSLIRAPRRSLLNGSNTERILQAPPFARRNALGVVPNRFLKVIVMCCCEEKPDAAETSEIGESALSSKLHAC